MNIQSKIFNEKRIYAFRDKEMLIEYILDKKTVLIALSAEKLSKCNHKLNKIINKNIAYPDGIGTVLAFWRNGISTKKIPGCELWLDIVKNLYKKKSFYLIGSTQEVISKTVTKLKEVFPGIEIKNFRDGYFQDSHLPEIKKDIQKKKPDVIFVAMGTPRQEYIMDELFNSFPALYMGLGGSFEIFVGKVKRAPKFFLSLKLEGLYRVISQPHRLARQKYLLKFIPRLIFNRF